MSQGEEHASADTGPVKDDGKEFHSNNESSLMKHPRKKSGESHRIYWQQWAEKETQKQQQQQHQPQQKESTSPRVTRSANVRMSSHSATARHVTDLLRSTLKLPESSSEHRDALVLIGTLYTLPPDFVQFEHEPPFAPPPSSSFADPPVTTTTKVRRSRSPPPPSSRAEFVSTPVHFLRTLRPSDPPLSARDDLVARLERVHRDSWAASDFQQAVEQPHSVAIRWHYVPDSPEYPSYVDVDGGKEQPHAVDGACGYCTGTEEEEDTDDEEEEQQFREKNEGNRNNKAGFLERKLHREYMRYIELRQSSRCVSGYLLKQSRRDPQVWRRVHCVLTEEHFWYVTRVRMVAPRQQEQNEATLFPRRMGRHHGRIELDGVEASASDDVLRVESADGTVHAFRCDDSACAAQWASALRTRAAEYQENRWLFHADLIVSDSTLARSRRVAAVVPSPDEGPLRLRLRVASYREHCRQKAMVVGSDGDDSASLFREAHELLSDVIREMVEQSGVVEAKDSGNPRRVLSRSSEQLCKHADYILTGRHRPIVDCGKLVSGEEFPKELPPVDLFDRLMSEITALRQQKGQGSPAKQQKGQGSPSKQSAIPGGTIVST